MAHTIDAPPARTAPSEQLIGSPPKPQIYRHDVHGQPETPLITRNDPHPILEPSPTLKDTANFRLVWSALILLLVFDLFTGRHFPRLYRIVRNRRVRPVAAPSGTTERVCDATNYACILYPKHVLCLQRSFVITCLLRRHGVPAQLVLGAQKAPFAAHAWVEVDRRAVNEERNVAAVYAVWERC